MDNNSSLKSVPVLQGKENYREWALAIKGIAYRGDFWSHYTNPNILIKEEDTPEGTTIPGGKVKVPEDDKDVLKLEMKAMGAILMTVSMVIKLDLDTLKVKDKEQSTYLTEVTREPCANDIWLCLKEKYETRDGVSALLDFKKFIHTSLTDDGIMEEQLNCCHELCSCCATNKFVIPEWQYAAQILLAIPNSYSHVQETFLTTGSIKNLKPDEVHARILETEI
jgi:hypothetical protein